MTPEPVKALAVIDEAIIQAVNLGALVRTDLFPGSGAVGRAWDSWRNQLRLSA